MLAAGARFSAPGLATMIVHVEIDVSLIRQVVLRPGVVPINGQAGNDVILPFEIGNLGNASEKLDVELGLPTGWSSKELRQTSLAIPTGETIKQRVRLPIPAHSSPGAC